MNARRLAAWTGEPVVQTLTAGRAGETAAEHPTYGHGVFTYHLLRALKGNADTAGGNADGLLTFTELLAYVKDKVANDRNADQDPQYGKDGDGEFLFLLPGESEGPADVAAVPRTRPPPRPAERPKVAVGPGTPHQIGSGLDTMVYVPAGWFIMGSKLWIEAMPQRRVYLDGFYIDKYPVTNARFRRFGRPKEDYGSKFNGARQPVVGVTWHQARDY